MGPITEEIREFVNKVKLGFVASVTPEGEPNLSPKGTTMAWDDHHLVFADIHSPGTSHNLQANPSVEVNVVDMFTRKGFRFKGKGEVISKGTLFDAVVLHYRDAGSKHIINNIVVIKVDQVLPIFSPAYDHNPSEKEITGHWIDYWHSIHPKE